MFSDTSAVPAADAQTLPTLEAYGGSSAQACRGGSAVSFSPSSDLLYSLLTEHLNQDLARTLADLSNLSLQNHMLTTLGPGRNGWKEGLLSQVLPVLTKISDDRSCEIAEGV